jgi:hypothetical protein
MQAQAWTKAAVSGPGMCAGFGAVKALAGSKSVHYWVLQPFLNVFPGLFAGRTQAVDFAMPAPAYIPLAIGD